MDDEPDLIFFIVTSSVAMFAVSALLFYVRTQ